MCVYLCVSLEEDALLLVFVLSEDDTTVDSNAAEAIASHRLQQLAADTEHSNARVVHVSDDDLVKGRARDAGGTLELADTHVMDELAVHAEHAHAIVVALGDCDVTTGHEAQSLRVHKLTVAATFGPEATTKSAVPAVEHTDAVCRTSLCHDDDGIIGAHASRTVEVTDANERVEVEVRRQHLHAVVEVLRHEHVVVKCYPNLVWASELKRPVASAADDPQPRSVRD